MDSEIAVLQDIRTAVWLLVYIVGAGVVLMMTRFVATSYRTIRTELNNAFYNAGSALFEKGKFSELIEFSHARLKKKPTDAYAFLFLGKAYYKIKAYDKATEYLNKVIEIYPSWKKEWVEPLLIEMEAERNPPPTHPLA